MHYNSQQPLISARLGLFYMVNVSTNLNQEFTQPVKQTNVELFLSKASNFNLLILSYWNWLFHVEIPDPMEGFNSHTTLK